MGRSKTILAFMLSPRSYICCAIMAREYVDLEQVYIECVDSTPLQESEVPEDRQKLMSCIILGYFAHVRQRGFREVLLRVPPPTDETGFVFSPRRPSARFRASMHLTMWFKYLFKVGKTTGIFHSYRSSAFRNQPRPAPSLRPAALVRFGCSPAPAPRPRSADPRWFCVHSQELQFPLWMMGHEDYAKERVFSVFVDTHGRGQGLGQEHLPPGGEGEPNKQDAAALVVAASRVQDRYFSALLARAPGDPRHAVDSGAHLPSVLFVDRRAFATACAEAGLRFHTEHASAVASERLVDMLHAEQARGGHAPAGATAADGYPPRSMPEQPGYAHGGEDGAMHAPDPPPDGGPAHWPRDKPPAAWRPEGIRPAHAGSSLHAVPGSAAMGAGMFGGAGGGPHPGMLMGNGGGLPGYIQPGTGGEGGAPGPYMPGWSQGVQGVKAEEEWVPGGMAARGAQAGMPAWGPEAPHMVPRGGELPGWPGKVGPFGAPGQHPVDLYGATRHGDGAGLPNRARGPAFDGDGDGAERGEPGGCDAPDPRAGAMGVRWPGVSGAMAPMYPVGAHPFLFTGLHHPGPDPMRFLPYARGPFPPAAGMEMYAGRPGMLGGFPPGVTPGLHFGERSPAMAPGARPAKKSRKAKKAAGDGASAPAPQAAAPAAPEGVDCVAEPEPLPDVSGGQRADGDNGGIDSAFLLEGGGSLAF
jgi:hypothetical protein